MISIRAEIECVTDLLKGKGWVDDQDADAIKKLSGNDGSLSNLAGCQRPDARPRVEGQEVDRRLPPRPKSDAFGQRRRVGLVRHDNR